MKRNASVAGGFTLVEVLVVVTIIAVAGAIVVPHLLEPSNWSVQAASRIVIADLLFAQNEAIARQAPRRVIFDAANNTYRVADNTDVTVELPFRGGDYVVDFDKDNRFSGVRLENVNLGGPDPSRVEFDPLGGTSAGGTLELATNNTRYRITVAPITGRVTVAPVP